MEVKDTAHPERDADAEMIAALFRLADKQFGRKALIDELGKIKYDLIDDKNYWTPFEQRIIKIKEIAGLVDA